MKHNRMTCQYEINQRKHWIDSARMFAMFCVVFGHTNGHLFSHGMPLFAEINSIIVFFNMPLFVLLSGYCQYSGIYRINGLDDFMTFSKKTFVHLILPCITIGVIFFVITHDLKHLRLNLYWFLKMLFILMISWGIIRLITYKYRKIPDILLFLVAMVLIDKYSSAEMSIYYAAGMLCKKYKLFVMPIKKVVLFWGTLLTAIAICFFFWDVALYQFYDHPMKWMVKNGLILNLTLRLLFGVSLSFLIIQYYLIYMNKENWLSVSGQKTLGISFSMF